jgi:hypothetical protein
MGVTSREMAMVRASLRGEDEEAQRLFREQLAVTGDAGGMAVLVHAAFLIAARRKFAPRYTRAEVIRYVAQVRALFSEKPYLLDALTGEDELLAALGDQVEATREVGAVALARLSLLHALIASLSLDDQGAGALLEQARELADRMLADVRPLLESVQRLRWKEKAKADASN